MRKLLALGAASLLTAGVALAGDLAFSVGDPQLLGDVNDLTDTHGTAVNAAGTVVGYKVISDPFAGTSYAAIRSVNGGAPDALAFPGIEGGWRSASANAVSENGIVAGFGTHDGYQMQAVMWDGSGAFTPLAPYYDEVNRYTYSSALAVSPNGQFIVGYAAFRDNGPVSAARWDVSTATPTELPGPCSSCDAYATGVNDAGDVVGYAYDAQGTGGYVPVRWQNGAAQVLSMPAGITLDVYTTTQPATITNRGDIFSSVSVFNSAVGDKTWHALHWDANGTVNEISTLVSAHENIAAVGASGLVLLRYDCASPCLYLYQLYLDGSHSTTWEGYPADYQAASAATGNASSSVAYLAGWSYGSHDQMTRTPVAINSSTPPPPPPNNAPNASLPSTVAASEGTAVTIVATVSDPDGPAPLTYQWDLDGNGSFETSTDSPQVQFTPSDNGSYPVSLRVSDGAGAYRDVATSVVARNVAPTVYPGNDMTAVAGQVVTLDATFGDAGSNDAPWSYTVAWGDQSNASTGQANVTSAHITPSHTYAAAGTYTVTITVSDKDHDGGTATLHVNVLPGNRAPVADAGGSGTPRSYSGLEGSAVSFDGSKSSDPDGDGLTYAWDFGDGQQGTGVNPTHTYVDNGTYTATVRVTDPHGLGSSASAPVNVANVAPSMGEIDGVPSEPIVYGTQVTLTASFTDPGLVDAPVGYVQWDSNSPFISTGVTTIAPTATSAGSISASSTPVPGVYTVSLRVQDKDGGFDQQTVPSDFIVIYDPTGGFVTGGGFIWSPKGACQLQITCVGAEGRANFGFVAKYQKNATTPSGNTEFNFQVGGFRFSSTSYDWLTVSGNKAQFQGSGTVNGAGNYAFLLTAIDGDNDSNMKRGDRFRIKIWDKDTGTVVYDNQMGQSNASDATTMLGGGSIQIHKQ